MDTWVGLLDCNNFFVSCERLFRPDLKNRPAVVLSSNDGCVVARSQEVKDIGIPMGVPYFKIKDILRTNNVAIFSGNPALYRDVSRRVFSSMKEVIDDMEQYSIDEAFFYTDADPEQVAKSVKDRVEQQVGIPVSLGIGRSKTLAKVANATAKKGSGVYTLTNEKWSIERKDMQLAQIWGVGPGLSKQFRDKSIHTVNDLLSVGDRQIKQLFGVVGLRLKKELSGEICIQKGESLVHKKSLMSSRTLSEPTTDIGVLRAALTYHINHIADELRASGLLANYLRIYILPSRFSDFALQGQVREVSFDVPTNLTITLLQQASVLLEQAYVAGVPYKKVGALAANLQTTEATQLSMFANNNTSDLELLHKSIDAINARISGGHVKVGMNAHATNWKPRSELRSPAYTTKWTDLPTVKA